PQTALANALEMAKSVVLLHSHPSDLRRIEQYLDHCGEKEPLVQALHAEIARLHTVHHDSAAQAMLIRLRWAYRRLLQQEWLLPVAVLTAVAVTVAVFIVALTETLATTGNQIG